MLGHVPILRQIPLHVQLVIDDLVVPHLLLPLQLLLILCLSCILLFPGLGLLIVVSSVSFPNTPFGLLLHVLQVKFCSSLGQQEAAFFGLGFFDLGQVEVLLMFLLGFDLFLLLEELLLVLEGCAFIGVFALFLMGEGTEESVVEGFLVDDHPALVLLPMLLHGVLLG